MVMVLRTFVIINIAKNSEVIHCAYASQTDE